MKVYQVKLDWVGEPTLVGVVAESKEDAESIAGETYIRPDEVYALTEATEIREAKPEEEAMGWIPTLDREDIEKIKRGALLTKLNAEVI
jgi:hypothetical protein